MNPREHRQGIEQVDAGRRAATLALQRLDLGLDPAAVVRELAPSISGAAVQAAVDLARLTSFDFAALSLMLAGLVPDSVIDGLEIPDAPARLERPGPDEVADAWQLGPLLEPTPPAHGSPEGDRRGY